MKNQIFKKTLAILCIMCLVAGFSISAVAQSHEDRVEYAASVDQTSVILPSEGVTLTINVTVNVKVLSDAIVNNVCFYVGESQEGIYLYTPDITSAQTEGANVTFPVQFSADMFNTDVPIYATYEYKTSAEGEISYAQRHLADNVRVDGVPAEKYELTLSPDKTVVDVGGAVTFSGTFVNKSGVTTDATAIIDLQGEYADGTEINISPIDIGGVEPGASKEISVICQDINGDFTVTPTVMTALGSESFATSSVQIKKIDIQFYLVASSTTVAYNDTIAIVYTIVNNSNVDITKMEILNENYDRILTPVTSLAPGKKINGSVSIKATGDKTIRYTINAKDALGGDVSLHSNSVDITLATSINDVVMGITAMVDKNQFSGPTQVTFNLTVSNKSNVEVANIEVTDNKGQLVKTIHSMAPNAINTFQVAEFIEESTNVFFTVTVTDLEGNKISFETEPMLISIDTNVTQEPTAPITTITIPTPTVEPTATPQSKDGNQILVTLLCIIGGLIVIGVILLIVMNILQKRAARKSRRIRRRIR